MSKNKADKAEELDLKQEAPQEQMSLDDSRRVKVLSPGMLVFKRFIRNKLAVAGIFILVIMFLFAFVGPAFSPYELDQVFQKQVEENGEYATGKVNVEPRFYGELSGEARTAVIFEIGKTKLFDVYQLETGKEYNVEAGGEQYTVKILNASPTAPSYAIYGKTLVATVRRGELKYYDPSIVDDGMMAVIRAHAESESSQTELRYNDTVINAQITKVETKYFVASDVPVALGTYNIYTPVNGKVIDLQTDAEFMHTVSAAVMKGDTIVDYDGVAYNIARGEGLNHILYTSNGDQLFNIERDYRYAKVHREIKDGDKTVTEEIDFLSTIGSEAEFRDALESALSEERGSFEYEGAVYTIDTTETEIRVNTPQNELGLVVANSFVPVETKYDHYSEDLDFLFELESAIASNNSLFMYDDERFTLVRDGVDYFVRDPNGYEMLLASDIAYGTIYPDTVLTFDFVQKLSEAIRAQSDSSSHGDQKFSFINEYGETVEAVMSVNNGNYYVKTAQKITLIDSRAEPSSDHALGTEAYGMDVMTRLMYGGRISLLVGFVVVFFEIILGVLVGGFSGYFGGVTDTILMRFVELFNCIPFYPMLLILGSLMDAQKPSPVTRLIVTMVILGILGWTGIARIVRGQILSLREQDFMIATEATGIRTSRRIFKHLVPNVMPLLIVNATQSLGDTILTEATLGFLGLGVKYPMASWGSIINQATDMQVMRTAWWIWIPAGLLILTTVLGFNFVGDGLRDAFDPKMKR